MAIDKHRQLQIVRTRSIPKKYIPQLPKCQIIRIDLNRARNQSTNTNQNNSQYNFHHFPVPHIHFIVEDILNGVHVVLETNHGVVWGEGRWVYWGIHVVVVDYLLEELLVCAVLLWSLFVEGSHCFGRFDWFFLW